VVGVAVLVSSHDGWHAALADRVLFLREGVIVDEATPARSPLPRTPPDPLDDPDAVDDEGAYR
jgi:hypothetical protein